MLKILRKSELIKGSLILFIMINIFNALNWLFHLVMIRLLGKVDYGMLAVLMSIVYIFSVPFESIQTVISRYTSKFNLKKEFGKMKFLLFKSLKKCFQIALIFFIIFLLVALFLQSFLRMSYWLFAITGLMLFASFLLPITRGILQGRKKFTKLGFNMVAESVFKISLAVILVLLGLEVYGAMGGVVMGVFLAFFISFLFIKEVINSEKEKADLKGISSYSFSVIIAILAIVLMYSLDIILARGFLSEELAGEYAAISMLGKIIFFGTWPISKAMFPISSEKFENGKKTSDILKKSVAIVLLLCISALLVFILFPGLILKIWTGTTLTTPTIVLFYVGLSLSFLSLTNLIVLYGFSINKMRNSFWLFIFVLLEIFLLGIFNKSVLQFSLAFLSVNILMFLSSLFLLKIKK